MVISIFSQPGMAIKRWAGYNVVLFEDFTSFENGKSCDQRAMTKFVEEKCNWEITDYLVVFRCRETGSKKVSTCRRRLLPWLDQALPANKQTGLLFTKASSWTVSQDCQNLFKISELFVFVASTVYTASTEDWRNQPQGSAGETKLHRHTLKPKLGFENTEGKHWIHIAPGI